MKKNHSTTLQSSIFALAIVIYFFSVNTTAYAQGKIYSFGVVPQFEARKLFSIWQPIVSYLEKETGYQFKLELSQTIPDFENEFMYGKFDFLYMNPYHLILGNKAQGYIPLLKDTSKRLYGILVVRKDGNIRTVADLKNKLIAFPAPNALGASLQMRQELNDIFHIAFRSTYVKTHDSVYLYVLLGKSDAGGGVQNTLSRQPQVYRDKLRIIHATKKVAPHPIAVHPRVPMAVRNAVKLALLKLAKITRGKDLLSKIPIKKIGVATLQDYLPLTKMGLERFYIKQY